MKLSNAHNLSLVESTFITPLPVLNEAGEAPKWGFNYSSFKTDPAPEILVLGAYKHPSTGNNLVGGINLNYLDKEKRDDLARVLPQLMQATNLYQRYHLGKQLLPGVFDNYYRTYNSAHIRGVTQGVFHPRYGMAQATRDFLQKKIGNLFKSKAQRAQDAEPKFPTDLSGMKDSLDQAVNKLGLEVAQGEEEPDTPEMKAAYDNFMQFKADRARSMADVERQEDEPLIQATQNFQTTQLQRGKATPRQVGPLAVQQVQQQQSIPTPPTPEPTPQQMGQAMEKERYENQQELTDPNNSLDLDGDGVPDDQQTAQVDPETQGYLDELDALGESVVYYCPMSKRYLVEDLSVAVRGHLLHEFQEDLLAKWRDELSMMNLNPDKLYLNGDHTSFIYTYEGQLYTDAQEENDTHYGIICANDDLMERYADLFQTKDLRQLRRRAETADLLGRVGSVKFGPYDQIGVVSFWNDDAEMYDDLLRPCLEALGDLINSSFYFWSPVHGSRPLSEVLDGAKPQEMTPDQQEHLELQKQMHLMRGAEKRAAMKKLGVGGGGKPHPMQTAMDRAGLRKPGEKWWAPTSESVLREPGSRQS